LALPSYVVWAVWLVAIGDSCVRKRSPDRQDYCDRSVFIVHVLTDFIWFYDYMKCLFLYADLKRKLNCKQTWLQWAKRWHLDFTPFLSRWPQQHERSWGTEEQSRVEGRAPKFWMKATSATPGDSIQFNSIQFYLYSAKLQQLSSQGT